MSAKICLDEIPLAVENGEPGNAIPDQAEDWLARGSVDVERSSLPDLLRVALTSVLDALEDLAFPAGSIKA